MITINVGDIKRHGNFIRLGQGRTAVEGMDGSMPTLIIRQKGRIIKRYRGSSLGFSDPLSAEAKDYLAGLGSDR